MYLCFRRARLTTKWYLDCMYDDKSDAINLAKGNSEYEWKIVRYQPVSVTEIFYRDEEGEM